MNRSWNLESLFEGGSSSSQFAAFVQETENLVSGLLNELRAAGASIDEGRLTEWTKRLQEGLAHLREADAFVACLTSQQMSDKLAVSWADRIQSLSAKYRQAQDLYEAKLADVPDDRWEAWTGDASLAAVRFPLEERRAAAREKLPPALESVASELAVDGYHGWGEHYHTIVSRISIPWTEDGEVTSLSAGQAANKLDDPNPEVRDRMAERWEEAWSGQADLCADTLNRLAGFRLKLYGLRGWNDPLREPLKINRMSEVTLEAMWTAVSEGIEPLMRYLAVKARVLGKPRLAWHDVDAPIAASLPKIGYVEAAGIIMNAFEQFSPNMAKLARRAFDEGWIESEDRPGKRPGGFCTYLPLSEESRIFMTYSGTPGNVSTLAHELGHAYHASLVVGLPPLAQDYAMNVAETASTFAEAIVSDALLRRAETDDEKLALLDDRLQRAVAFFMNIRARFLFEKRFYERRATGIVEAEELDKLMTWAQQEAFGDALGSWHPLFWASKLHFYLTDVPFYNFPYTFGYLFSTGLLVIAEREGEGFRTKYDLLLKDTGVMTVERLALEHLGVRLDEPTFWRDAVAQVNQDVERFEALCSTR